MSITAMQWYYDGEWCTKHQLDAEYEKPDPEPIINTDDWCPICDKQTGSLYTEHNGKWTIECVECSELHASGLVDEE